VGACDSPARVSSASVWTSARGASLVVVIASMLPAPVSRSHSAPARAPLRSSTMTDVPLTAGGPPETVLPPEPEEARAALERARAEPLERRRAAVSDVVERWPASLDAWARLGELARDDVEAYACFRVGYHRRLDRLRQSGWRGSGYVRWRQPTN